MELGPPKGKALRRVFQSSLSKQPGIFSPNDVRFQCAIQQKPLKNRVVDNPSLWGFLPTAFINLEMVILMSKSNKTNDGRFKCLTGRKVQTSLSPVIPPSNR